MGVNAHVFNEAFTWRLTEGKGLALRNYFANTGRNPRDGSCIDSFYKILHLCVTFTPTYNTMFTSPMFAKQQTAFLAWRAGISTQNLTSANYLATALAMDSVNTISSNISRASAEQAKAISSAARSVTSALEDGFEGMEDGLTDVAAAIEQVNDTLLDIARIMNEGFAMLADRLDQVNNRLDNIQQLLRIPDSQKQRVYHIEEGIKYLTNAYLEGPESPFFADALDEFNKALAIERKDYYSLYRIGRIYYGSAKHYNLPLAETSFKTAARYCLAEAQSTTTTANMLINNTAEKGASFFTKEGAQALLYAAFCCYAQGKTDEALQLAQQAWETNAQDYAAGFTLAKYLFVKGNNRRALELLEHLIKQQRAIALTTVADTDLVTIPEVGQLLSRLAAEAIADATGKYERCLKVKLSSSTYNNMLARMDTLIKQNNYLDARQAIDLFENPVNN